MLNTTAIPHRVCMAIYRRRVPWTSATPSITCTYLKDHEGDHSWQPLMDADQEAMRPPPPERTAPIGTLIQDIMAGRWDAHLESILAAGHERKRTLRGRPTFGQGGGASAVVESGVTN